MLNSLILSSKPGRPFIRFYIYLQSFLIYHLRLKLYNYNDPNTYVVSRLTNANAGQFVATIPISFVLVVHLLPRFPLPMYKFWLEKSRKKEQNLKCININHSYVTRYVLEVLRGQPIKLIQVVSTSEFHEYWWKGVPWLFQNHSPTPWVNQCLRILRPCGKPRLDWLTPQDL